MTSRTKTQKQKVDEVAHAVERHERVCEQRWNENFRQLADMKYDINTSTRRTWHIAGVVITLLTSLVVHAFFLN